MVKPVGSAQASLSYWLLSLLQEIYEWVVTFFQPGSAFASEVQVETETVMSVVMLEESIPTGQVWKTYYYAGSQRVAMRVNDGETDEVYYLFSDHLGSTSITTDIEGNWYGELRYTAWGTVRYANGAMLTDYTYTGQRSEVSSFGLMYYNARWYDSALGRFVQADSIIPEPGNTLAWDRFAYSYNNPVIYVDPDGHDPLDHEWYRVFRSTHNGRIPDIIDTKIRLFSLAYPEEYKQYDFYDVEGNYNIDVVRDVFSSPPETRSWGTMPSALSNLSKWYEPDETEEYVRDVGTLYSYLPIRHQQPDINLAVQEIVFRNPAVYINPEGLPNHLLDEDLTSNVHHFGWALNLGWSTSLDAAILINTLREFNSVNFNINQVNSADISLGNRAVILAFDLKTFGIHPDRILVTTNTIILAD